MSLVTAFQLLKKQATGKIEGEMKEKREVTIDPAWHERSGYRPLAPRGRW